MENSNRFNPFPDLHEGLGIIMEIAKENPPDLTQIYIPAEAARFAWEWAYKFLGIELGHAAKQEEIDLPYHLVLLVLWDHFKERELDLDLLADAMHDGLAMWADAIVERDSQQLPYLQQVYDACRFEEE